MNSKVLAPVKVQLGAIEITNMTGGEINWDKIIPETVEATPTEYLYKVSSHDLRKEMERCKEELRNLPKMYSIINGVVKRNIRIKGQTLALRERIRVGYIILNRRSYKRVKTIKTFDKRIYEVVNKPMNRGIFIDYIYEEIKGDKMIENEIDVKEEYTDEFGELHPEVITKKCVIPYNKERNGIKKKDFLILHRSGRLAIRAPSGRIVSSTGHGIQEDEENLQKLFKTVIDNEGEFFVILPKGGSRNKEYGEIPMAWTKSSIRGNKVVPVNQITRKLYKPEIDGRTPRAKEIINEYRGSTKGFGPIYEYDEENHTRMYVPDVLSYNHVEYSDKMIILLGTEEKIKQIDGRINSANKVKRGYHKFTNEEIVPYKGQISRCENNRIMISKKNEVQVFGLNLKGTPEEDLKGYLRNFDKAPQQRVNEEVEEILEVAHKQDGRQTIFNIEHDLRYELKHLRTRTGRELYSLILGVEDEIHGLPNKKEQALLNVLESFKSSKDIQEQEGKGLTSEINDLVTQEENSNDSSYKKSKNLFSQQLGVLLRNQNPLKMEGDFTPLRTWSGKGGPISFPTNEKLPKRSIKFVKRSNKGRIEVPLRTMFIRGFNYSVKTEKIRTDKGITSKDIGIRIESEPLFHSSSSIGNLFDFVMNNIVKMKPIKEVKARKPFNLIGFVLTHPINKEALEKYSKKNEGGIQDVISKEKIGTTTTNRVVRTVTGLDLPAKKVHKTHIVYKEGTMFPRRVTKITPVTGRMLLQEKRGRLSRTKKYYLNECKVPTARLFDDRNNPGPVFKKMTWKQYLASEQQSYQYSGKIVFKQTGIEKLEDGTKLKVGEFVRTPHNKPSSFSVLHTIGDGNGNIDYYIIKINGKTLYAKGNLSLLNKESISFTGTRNPKKPTRSFIKKTLEMFFKDDSYVTISGGAEGCDTLVHYQTIKQGGKTIVVLAGGFNSYRKQSQIKIETVLENDGLILSEHHPDYSPSKGDFIQRNKIITDLSEKLVVFEAGNGTLHCARFGIELNKELLIQPGFKNNQNLLDSGKGKLFIPMEGCYPF